MYILFVRIPATVVNHKVTLVNPRWNDRFRVKTVQEFAQSIQFCWNHQAVCLEMQQLFAVTVAQELRATNMATRGGVASPASSLCIITAHGPQLCFPSGTISPGPKGLPCPSAETSSFTRAGKMATFWHMHIHTDNNQECYLEAWRMVGSASRGPKSEIISVIHILLPDTNDLIMLMWSELTSVVWMGLMCSHSSISQDYVVDQRCVCVCVCMCECEQGPMYISWFNRRNTQNVVDSKAPTLISENLLSAALICAQQTECELQSHNITLKSTSHQTLCPHNNFRCLWYSF